MKEEMINKLTSFRNAMRALKKDVQNNPGDRISRQKIRFRADNIATQWVEELRSPLEHKFGISKEKIDHMAEQMKQLHVLSRPSNLKSSYIKTLNSALSRFDNRFILPIKQGVYRVEGALDLHSLIPSLSNLSDSNESDYWEEAGKCAEFGLYRATIVMGWCATVHQLQQQIYRLGLDKLNQASGEMKNKTVGKYKNWNKKFSISTVSELQGISDADLITLLEYLEFFDSNQADRLRACLQYRNQSAHPGEAPIGKDHVKVFFSDIGKIIFDNPKMKQ